MKIIGKEAEVCELLTDIEIALTDKQKQNYYVSAERRGVKGGEPDPWTRELVIDVQHNGVVGSFKGYDIEVVFVD